MGSGADPDGGDGEGLGDACGHLLGHHLQDHAHHARLLDRQGVRQKLLALLSPPLDAEAAQCID